MKKKKLTISFHIGDEEVTTLSEEQRESMGEKLSQVMSDYYSANLDEFQKIKEK